MAVVVVSIAEAMTAKIVTRVTTATVVRKTPVLKVITALLLMLPVALNALLVLPLLAQPAHR